MIEAIRKHEPEAKGDCCGLGKSGVLHMRTSDDSSNDLLVKIQSLGEFRLVLVYITEGFFAASSRPPGELRAIGKLPVSKTGLIGSNPIFPA